MPATAKIITLKGDPKNPESAEHIIIFPGGSISVCRTSNNEYWAHIEVTKEIIEDTTRESKIGIVSNLRLDYDFMGKKAKIESLPALKELIHMAVRIKTKTKLSKTQVELNKMKLWNADPNCKHDVIDAPGGGVRCKKCNGWFCY